MPFRSPLFVAVLSVRLRCNRPGLRLHTIQPLGTCMQPHALLRLSTCGTTTRPAQARSQQLATPRVTSSVSSRSAPTRTFG